MPLKDKVAYNKYVKIYKRKHRKWRREQNLKIRKALEQGNAEEALRLFNEKPNIHISMCKCE